MPEYDYVEEFEEWDIWSQDDLELLEGEDDE